MIKERTYVCPTCSKEYHPKKILQIYCCVRCSKLNSLNYAWKGDNIGLETLHRRIANKLGRPDRCGKCGNIGMVDLANISQEYKHDLSDWEWLCRKCHMESDGRLDKFLSHSNKNNRIPEKKCTKCGKEFKPRSNKSAYCSKSCSASANNLKRDYSYLRGNKNYLNRTTNNINLKN
mgnify:CR=1 FL=1